MDRRQADRRASATDRTPRPRVDDLRTGERVYVERRKADRRATIEHATGTLPCPLCEEHDEAESGGTACGVPECYRGRVGGWRDGSPVRCSPEQVRAVDAWLGRLAERPADRRARLRRWLRQ